MIFQQYSASSHHGVAVQQYFNQKLSNRRKGIAWPILWPPRAPDLHQCYYVLRGYLKDHVFREPLSILEDLKNQN